MKVLFLQKVDNAKGGVTNVNYNLITFFLSLGYEVDVVSVRHGDSWENVEYPEAAKTYLINDKDVWGCPLFREVLTELKQAKMISAMRLFFERMKYEKKIHMDYEMCQTLIEKLQPDVIINSHYETLKGVGENYLSKTIMHFHTSFDQVIENRSYMKIFREYASKIYSFVWLSKRTMEEAVRHGFQNSKYIYNPLTYSEEKHADMSNKKLVFIGRMSEEKRVHLAIEYFREVLKDNKELDWTFEIYGDGNLADNIKEMVAADENIFYMGRTENVQDVLLQAGLMVLTSSFEGMPLAVLEANECGVPVIAYDFGESSSEVIQHKKTGILVPQDDKEVFKQELLELMKNQEYRSQLSREAKQFAKTFSKEAIGKCWVDLFEEINCRSGK